MELLYINFTIVVRVGFIPIQRCLCLEFFSLFLWQVLGHLFESFFGFLYGDDFVTIFIRYLQDMFHDLFGGRHGVNLNKVVAVVFLQDNGIGAVDEHECGNDEK
tara:strand:- start:129 stop:440 length:312 start_codon:yes stop_codon:yes gene_type:complete